MPDKGSYRVKIYLLKEPMMKLRSKIQATFISVLLMGVMSFNANLAAASSVSNLDPFKWENRIVLGWSEQPEQLVEQLTNQTLGIVDRDIVWFVMKDNAVLTNYDGQLADSFAQNLTAAYKKADYAVVLIGKDGGVKVRASELYVNQLFSTIDRMPMRRYEMTVR